MVTHLAAALFIGLIPAVALAEPTASRPAPAAPANGPRIRPHDARSGALLLQGIERSATLRAIVDELEQRDVIVYLEMQPMLKRNLAGRMIWLARAGSVRYVRIFVSPELSSGLAIATLGHELQHALEVAREPSIVDDVSLERYYKTHGISMSGHASGWDTHAARDAGDAVRRDLVHGNVATVAESIQGINPEEWHIAYWRARGMLPP